MANLLDAIRNNTNAMATQKQGMEDETGKLQSLLRAKSGRETSGGDIAASNLGEQQAVQNTNTQMQNSVAPAASIQNADIEAANRAQEAGVATQKQTIAQNRNIDSIQTRIKTNQLLQDLEQNKGRIDQQQKDSMVQQAAQNLRLQNQKYVDNLQREGGKSRLDDANSFQEELARSVMGDNKEMLQESLGNQSILDASDRDFKKAVGDMSVGNAYDVFRNAQKAEQQRAIYTGIGSLVSAGVGAAGSMGGGTPAPSGTGTAAKSNYGTTSYGGGSMEG